MSEPQRLHPAAILILAIRIARQLVLPMLAPVAFDVMRRGFGDLDFRILIFASIMLTLLVLISAGWGLIYWRRYTFRVTSSELQVQQGIIFRRQRTIPLERIQAIDLVEGVLHRVFGVVAVRVQTAGGPGPGLSLVGISRSQANTLRSELSARAGDVRVQEETGEGTESAEPEPLRRLPVSQLVLAAATSGGIGIALPIIGSAMSILNNALRDIDLFETATGFLGGTTWWSVAIIVLLAAWVMSFAGTILAHAGFTIRRVDDNLLIERGLIEKRRATVPINRIQAIRIIDSVIRQPFGYTMIRVESAGYGMESGESTVLYPFLHRDDVPAFLEQTVPEFAAPPTSLQRPPRRAIRRYVMRMLWLGLAVCAIVGVVFYPTGLYALLALPLFGAFGWLRYRDAGWATAGDRLVLRYRTLARSTALVPRRRMQSSDVSQSILQRRASLGSIAVTVASGPSGATFRVIHLDKLVADQLFAWTGRGQVRSAGREPTVRQLRPQTE